MAESNTIIEPTADQEEKLLLGIGSDVYKQIYDTANQRIEEEKEKARNGDWGFLVSFFELLDDIFGFGLVSWLAEKNGTIIPTEQEVDNLAKTTREAVESALSDPNLPLEAGKEEEFKTEMKKRIITKLNEKKADFSSIPEANLTEIAEQTANTIATKFNEQTGVFDAKTDNNAQANPPNTAVKPTAKLIKSGVEKAAKDGFAAISAEQLKNLAMLAQIPEFKAEHFNIVVKSLQKTIADIDDKELEAKGIDAFAFVAEKIRTELLKNKDKINNDAGMKINDAGIIAVSDKMAEQIVKKKFKDLQTPADFLASSKEHEKTAINQLVETKIKAEVLQAIVDEASFGVRSAHNEKGDWMYGTAWNYKEDTNKAIEILNKYYDQEGNYLASFNKLSGSALDKAEIEIKDAKTQLNKFAAGMHYSLNASQREEVSKIVAQTVSQVLADSANANLNQGQLAEKLKSTIHNELTKKTSSIDALGKKDGLIMDDSNTIAVINENNSDKDKGKTGDIFKQIAEEFANKIKEDKTAYSALNSAKKALQSGAIIISGVEEIDASCYGDMQPSSVGRCNTVKKAAR